MSGSKRSAAPSSAAAAVALKPGNETESEPDTEAVPCRALLESLHACGGRPEAIRLLVSLDLFGDDKCSDDRGGGGGAGDGREKAADWNRQASEDGIAVLTALVESVTAAATKTAARRESGGGEGRGGGGGGGGGVGGGFGRGAAGGPAGVDGLEEFGIQESEALSSVCVEALRALVRCSYVVSSWLGVCGAMIFSCHVLLLISA